MAIVDRAMWSMQWREIAKIAVDAARRILKAAKDPEHGSPWLH